MLPFRVFDKEKKQMWQVINYHPGTNSDGSYLATKEDDDVTDGDMRIIPAQESSQPLGTTQPAIDGQLRAVLSRFSGLVSVASNSIDLTAMVLKSAEIANQGRNLFQRPDLGERKAQNVIGLGEQLVGGVALGK